MADENLNETEGTEAETPAEEAPVKEPVAEEAAAEPEEIAEAPVVEAPAAEAEETAEQPVAEAPAAEAEEATVEAEAPADEPAAEAAVKEAAPAPQSGPKPKRKRLPRSERRQRTKPKRTVSTARKPIVRLEKPEQERGRRQERQGTVVSDAMEKTIVVRVDVVKAHPRYKKVVRRSVKFHAHDETEQAKVGDVVRIVETRPLSKTKRWRLAEVVQAAK
jgi:small subunit ribosomal protein S17